MIVTHVDGVRADGSHRNGVLRITIACTGVAAAHFSFCLHVKSRHLGDAYRYPTEIQLTQGRFIVLRTTLIFTAIAVACSFYAVGEPVADGSRHTAGTESDAMVLAVSSDGRTISVWTPLNSCFKHARLDTAPYPTNVWIESGFCCIRDHDAFYAINSSSPNWTRITLTDKEMETVKIGSHHIVASTERGTFVYGANAVQWSGVSISGDDIPMAENGG
ncbi:hypothetical protein LF1_54540 [Rubripirellula obstinata]|uniref:Uncharacterized protein n=1 Tax=Rubripirellula obstinata TaxID=406547 RepID=A0A5B1CBE8_9BACT|nr:hypothetical protein [Rubripirellula obstinata]KAA1257305.1 hypothetical protein LF1_54540 [Rubripirellula obstinata]